MKKVDAIIKVINSMNLSKNELEEIDRFIELKIYPYKCLENERLEKTLREVLDGNTPSKQTTRMLNILADYINIKYPMGKNADRWSFMNETIRQLKAMINFQELSGQPQCGRKTMDLFRELFS